MKVKTNLKIIVYGVLEKKSHQSKLAASVQMALALLIVGSTILSMWETVPENDTTTNWGLQMFQDFCGVVFLIEYLLRLWVIPVAHPGHSPLKTRINYFFKPTMLLDLLVIAPFALPFIFSFDATGLRIFRLLRIMRFARFGRFSKSLNSIVGVIKKTAPELAVSMVFSFALLIIAATGIYHFEKDAQPVVFSSIPQSIWWAINILTGISFGDFYPQTLGGRIFAGIISLLGVGTIALPAGIIASGILEAINANKKQKVHKCPNCGEVGRQADAA